MPRLLRPHIPFRVRCLVVLRQLGEMWPEQVLADWKAERRPLASALADNLAILANLLGCTPADLHLDHYPALAIREKVIKRGLHVGYIPDANDPDALVYREKHAHHIKTNIRGIGAQHPDRVLIKKARRLEKAGAAPKKPAGKKRPAPPRPKQKWASRPLRSRNTFRHP